MSRPRALFAVVLAVGLGLAACEATETPHSDTRPDWCGGLPRPANALLPRVTVASDWYEVYLVDPDVYALLEPRQFEEVVSYLVVGRERALLFDTGLGIEPIAPVVRELTDRPIVVVSSHTHPDHVGGNAAFTEILNTDTEYSATNAQGFGREELAEIIADGSVCGLLPTLLNPENYVIDAWAPSGHLIDQQKIQLGGREVEVLLTPGHSPDALMLLDRAAGLLLTGDSFYEGPIYVMDEYSNFEDYVTSINRVAGLAGELTKLLPGHNVAVSDPILLRELGNGVEALASGSLTPDGSRDGNSVYSFSSFSVIVPDSVAQGN